MTPNTPDNSEEDRIEVRVRQMMEPDRPERPGDMVVPETSAPGSAPELPSADAPVDAAPAEPAVPAAASTPDPTAETATDEAVDDITKHEADDNLRLQDEAATSAPSVAPPRQNRLKQFWADWWGSPRGRWGTVAAVVVIILGLFALPVTRYQLLGLVLKHQVTVRVLDSKTQAPVSGVRVQLDGQSAETAADGTAKLRVHLGSHALTVSKKYYQTVSSTRTVTLSAADDTLTTTLLALGRQVPVKIVDRITGQPLANAVLDINHAHTKTAVDGTATVVAPSSASTQQATVSLDGYNSTSVSITVSDHLLGKNTFRLTPAGKVYFLSNLSGNIDVVQTNLDGTDRQTILAGTGNEDAHTTSLLASHDWKYLALLSKRAGSNASLYLIDTTNGNKLTTIDEGNVDFNLVGWSGDRFVYQVTRHTIPDWKPNQQVLKSFDATTGQTLLLDQTKGSGTGADDYIKQNFGSPYIIGNRAVYTKGWEASYNNAGQVVTQSAELDSIGVDGSGHQTVKTFTMAKVVQASGVYVTAEPAGPSSLSIYFSDGNKDNFYRYEDGKVTAVAGMTADTFFQDSYPTYLQSPSGGQTFWAERRDGKNTLFVGDPAGSGKKQIASLSDYSPYGWYTDKYLLVSKGGSELYIMPVAGGTPLKVTDYYNSALSYNGYGGL